MNEIYLTFVMGVGGDLTGDLCERLMNSAHRTASLAVRHGLSMELVIVEWNLPPGVTIKGVFDWPAGKIPIRIIHAGHLHRTVPNPHGFRYFEWYPKNIGIRRARGEFVLSTNPDILHVDEMIAALARRELKKGFFYRAIRHDTRNNVVFAVNWPTGPKRPDASPNEIRQNLPRACPWAPNMIAYNAAGDFTMMSREDWFMIRGNPERDYNDSVDGQTLWLAHTLGLEQIVLPYPIFHPDHHRTLNHAYVPGWDDNKPHAEQNGEHWGFNGIELPESLI